jgi:hypothetical protein
MEHESRPVRLYAVERVRCLECGTTYGKPRAGGTVQENPGCPRCGYLGWISGAIPEAEGTPRRIAEDRRLRRSPQLR